MHLVLSAADGEPFLKEELRRTWPVGVQMSVAPRLFFVEADLDPVAPPCLVFARQMLPEAAEAAAPSISGWSQKLLEVIIAAQWPAGRPWLLHVEPCYGSGSDQAGRNRCRLILDSLRERLRRQHRQLLRAWRVAPEPFSPDHSLVQLVLTSPENGFVSVAAAPRPYGFRSVLCPFPLGEIPVAVDKAAPSRAFAKLVEAEQRMGRQLAPGDTCVDLGAAPGSWTYVALNRGARVIAVDRAPLRDDLMRHPSLAFHRGDAFQFEPEAPVDWLFCDVIAAPERSIELALDWVRRRRTRHFAVTIKFKGHEDYALLEILKQAMPPLCDEFSLTRLCANKNEACAFGTVRGVRPFDPEQAPRYPALNSRRSS